ncbi:MAG: alpha/beta hydrolase [Candidatus Helarchaeota archaeon]
MSKNEDAQYSDYWFNYCLDIDPNVIKDCIKEEYIKTRNNKIHLDIYDKLTDQAKPTILFIHGTAVYSRFYAEFLYGLHEEGFRIIGMDLPGHGLSSGKRGHFSIEELVDAIYDVNSHVINTFDQNVIIMGSSLGGILTLYSVANDERYKAGVCVNAALLNESGHKEIVKVKGIFKILKPLVPVFSKIFPTLGISVWRYLEPMKLIHKKESMELVDTLLVDKLLSDKYSLKSLSSQMKAAPSRPIENIETPLMILNGSDDVLFSVEYMQRIFERLTSSKHKKFEIIPESSHMILLENREESIQRIISWLNELS